MFAWQAGERRKSARPCCREAFPWTASRQKGSVIGLSGHVRLDALGPDDVGSHISLQTVQGARTVEVPGGSQALGRTEVVEIRVGKSSGAIPVPVILGAILVKVRAIEVDDVPQAQRADVAFLLSLVEDPDPLAIEIGIEKPCGNQMPVAPFKVMRRPS
jgi:hypothetical protein